MAAKPVEIESLLECCICLGDCQDPRLLPCAHSLCKQCLEDHIKTSAQGGQYQCPACRHTCDVPPEGASGVPKNFFLNNLRDILQRQRGEQRQTASSDDVESKVTELECSNKDVETITHTSVTVYCVQCSKFLCFNCESFHKLFVSESHDLRPAEEVATTGGQTLKPRRQKPRCDQHAALHNDMYCDTCHVSMCMKCCLLKHQQHKYRELDDLAEETQANLVMLRETAEKRYGVLEKHLQKLDGTKTQMDTDAEKASREVCKAADELIDLVIQRKQSLVQEIKDFNAIAATELNAAYKETQLHIATVQSLRSYIEALQTSGDVSDQVVYTPGLQQQLRQQEALTLRSVSWTVDFKRSTENVATVHALLGTVSREQTVDRLVCQDEDKKVKLGSPLLTLLPQLGQYSFCAGITKIGDCVCAVGSGEPYLWLHNCKTDNSKQHTLTGLQAAGMTTVGNNSNTLVITDRDKKLHFITINPQNMSITKQLTKDISFEPRSVVYDHTTDRLTIANYSDKQIVICSKTGDIEKRITVKTKLGNMMCALPPAGGAYIVLDYIPGRVHWVNQSGDVTHTYGAGAGKHLNRPWHMLQDSQGRLLVADTFNQRICLMNNQQFSHDLITGNDGIQLPSYLYLDETAGTFYVGYYTDAPKLNMYKWLVTSADTDTLSKSFKLRLNLSRYQ